MSSSIDTMTLPVEQPPTGKHPKGLYVLFMAEMWERFCYYGMRVLLTLYLIKSLLKGDNQAFAIYGAYTALVYAAPVLGGRIADTILGYRIAVILGGVLMAIGEFMILGGTDHWLYIGMGTIIVGNGYFKANISSIVGKLYQDGDPRRDSGFTIFYIGINIGALLSTLICAEVGDKFGFQYGFALAGVGMILGLLFFVGGQKHFRHAAEPPHPERLHKPYLGPLSLMWTTILASLLVVPVLYFLILYNKVVLWLLIATAAFVLYSLLSRGLREGPVLRDRMVMFIVLMLFNIVFWACFEQAGTSLTLFADRNVDRTVFGYEMGAATTQFFNPAFIIIMGSVFSLMWVYLNRIGRNPNIPMKFGIGIVLLGLGYLVVNIVPVSPIFTVPLWTLILLYFLHTVGELFISPIGLSMVTKLVPKDMTGTAMGAWFLSFAWSNYMAALLAMATGSGHGGGAAERPQLTYAQQLEELIALPDEAGMRAMKGLSVVERMHDHAVKAGAPPAEVGAFKTQLTTMLEHLRDNLYVIGKGSYIVLHDSAAHVVPKHVRFKDKTALVHNQFLDVLDGLDSLNHRMDRVTRGVPWDEARPEVAEAILGINQAFDVIRSEFYDEMRGKRAKDDLFLDPVKTGLDAFAQHTSTLMSHMYWRVYSRVYTLMGMITVAIGLFLMAVSGRLNRLMHGIN
jgi:POT family proton-dependent oligopeptide transporter